MIMTFSTYIPRDAVTQIVLSAPHCGVEFPTEFLFQSPLSREALLETADIGTDMLIDSFNNVTTIKAHFARSFVDLNRARTQFDNAVIADIDMPQDPQSRSGYGVIPRFARHGRLTHSAKISMDDAQQRLRDYYDPYHNALSELLTQKIDQFGQVLLIDVHSAPAHILKDMDVQIGTLHGQTCSHEIISLICNAFEENGLKIGLEIPFAGGHITRHYSERKGIQTIQIEVNRQHIVDSQNQINLNENSDFLIAWRRSIHKILNGAKL